MEIVKVNPMELKRLEKSPIREERYQSTPVVIINEKKEILFGENTGASPFINEDGTLTCLMIPSTELESKKLAFDLHYLGMTGIIDFDNFNNMPKEALGAPYDLFLFSAPQFEQAVAAKKNIKSHTYESEFDLF